MVRTVAVDDVILLAVPFELYFFAKILAPLEVLYTTYTA